ncbi:MAG: hypothetical protein J7647_07115 [Cyanobacteria bacterium SBLK]|nr:hypothetical protein [Cyanobacteria bacterium SBLK]
MTLHENSLQINLVTCTTRPCEPMASVEDNPLVPDPLLLLTLLGGFGLTALFGSQKHC